MQNQISKPRRHFLSGSVVASLGAAVLGLSPARGQTVEESPCDRFFLTDHLSQCGHNLDSVLSVFLSRALVSVSITLDQCIALHHRLECLIICLESELGKTGDDTDLRQIRELCEACRKSAEYMKSLKVTDQDVRKLAAGVMTLSKQVCERARKLLPDQEVKLTKNAAAILRNIICLLDDEEFLKLNKQLAGYSSYSEQANNIIKQFEEIRTRLKDARSYVVDLENPCFKGSRELSQLNAETQIGKALTVLKNVVLQFLSQPATPTVTKPDSPVTVLNVEFIRLLPEVIDVTSRFDKDKLFSVTPGPGSVLSSFDELILSLVWIKKAVKTIAPPPLSDPKQCDPNVAMRDEDKQSSRSAAYMKVTARNESPEALAKSISELLSGTCPPGSTEQVTQCKKIVEGVRKARWLFSLTDDSCKAWIRKGLSLSETIRSMPVLACPNSDKRETLVLGLFNRL